MPCTLHRSKADDSQENHPIQPVDANGLGAMVLQFFRSFINLGIKSSSAVDSSLLETLTEKI